ncbi:MAG: hypothetical protein IPL61_13535 [Myxococcales bacterium]|nr:hypothetical protein [Myxococcales bacterium]
MGKVDDMRRLREAQHRQRQAPAAARGAAAAVPDAAAPADGDGAEGADEGDGGDAPELDLEASSGKCSSCGKVKAMNRGVVVDHQKGLGKRCPGSRKPPA